MSIQRCQNREGIHTYLKDARELEAVFTMNGPALLLFFGRIREESGLPDCNQARNESNGPVVEASVSYFRSESEMESKR